MIIIGGLVIVLLLGLQCHVVPLPTRLGAVFINVLLFEIWE